MDDLLCQAKAFFFHVLRKKHIKASEFAGLVLGRYADSSDGPACNFLYILGMRGGVMTSLALLHCLFQGAIVMVRRPLMPILDAFLPSVPA